MEAKPFLAPADEVIALTINVFKQIKGLEARPARLSLVRLMTLYLRSFSASQEVHDQVFKITLSDPQFHNYAYIIFENASTQLLCDYRALLLFNGDWTRLSKLAEFMKIELSHDEIEVLSRGVCHRQSEYEREAFCQLVRMHPTFPPDKKFIALFVLWPQPR